MHTRRMIAAGTTRLTRTKTVTVTDSSTVNGKDMLGSESENGCLFGSANLRMRPAAAVALHYKS